MRGTAMHTPSMRYAIGTSVGERGQITIERDIRRALDIQPKDVAVQRVEHGRLVVEFIRPVEPHTRSLAGILGPSPLTPQVPSDEDASVGASISEEWRDYLAREARQTSETPSTSTPRRRAR